MKRLLLALCLLLITTPALAHPGWGGHGGGWGQGWGGSAFGNALGGSIAGSIIGNAIGNMFAPPPVVVQPAPVIVAPQPVPEMQLQPFTTPWYDYCARRFRTFDPHSGYYTGFDGQPHFCS